MSQFFQDIKQCLTEDPIGDITGGLMAAIVALPLCLAFGVASGLGAAAGLYGAIACGVLAAIFGGTKGQCSGPTGPMTVVVAGLFATSQARAELVFAAIIIAGILQIALGRLKAGQLISYIPYPVISGFMTGIGAIIICIQIGPLFGLPGSGNVLAALQNLVNIPKQINVNAALIGFGSLAIIYFLPFLSKRLPVSLIALVLTTWIAYFYDLKVPQIGQIPSGLPMPKLPLLGLTDAHMILQGGLTLALLGTIDSLLTSLVLDKVTGKRHDSNQELVGQGIGNMAAGLIGGLPGAGATMRSMVNIKSGGTTKLSGVVHGLLLLAVLLGLGKIASMIPLSTLAAILISVGIGIMDWRALRGARTLPRADVIVMIVVLSLTIFVDLIIAVLIGVAAASILFVKQLSDAETSSVGDLESLEEMQEITEQMTEELRRSIYTYQFNGPLFFGEAKNLSAMVEKLSSAKYIILRFYNVPLVDQTGAYALEDAIEQWESQGTRVLFVGIQSHLTKTLEDTGVIHKIDMDNCFDDFEDALVAIANFENQTADTEHRKDFNAGK